MICILKAPKTNATDKIMSTIPQPPNPPLFVMHYPFYKKKLSSHWMQYVVLIQLRHFDMNEEQ